MAQKGQNLALTNVIVIFQTWECLKIMLKVILIAQKQFFKNPKFMTCPKCPKMVQNSQNKALAPYNLVFLDCFSAYGQ